MDIKIINYKYLWQFKIAQYLPEFINKIVFKNFRQVIIYKNCIPAGFSMNTENGDSITQQIAFTFNNKEDN